MEKFREYIYRDNSNNGIVFFRCKIRGILEADKMYEEFTGENPAKQNHIGCSIEFDPDEELNK